MDIILSTNVDGISWKELAHVFELAPLGKKRDPQKLELAFRNSQLSVFAFHGKELVGAGRAISDGVWRATIFDVAILPEYHRRGIGSKIIRHLIQTANVDVVMLYSVPGKEAYYERFGFHKMKTAMAIFPNEEEARKRGLIE